MVEGKTIHGLYCPECGGTLALVEGQVVVNCPYCGVSSLLTGLTGGQGVWRLRVRRAVEREGALRAVKRFLPCGQVHRRGFRLDRCGL